MNLWCQKQPKIEANALLFGKYLIKTMHFVTFLLAKGALKHLKYQFFFGEPINCIAKISNS